MVEEHVSTRPRITDWAVYALILFFSMIQEFGRTTLDTRIELTERPASFLAGAFTLWHDTTNFGELLNQAYGYLFPQGAFFVLVEWSGLPPWVGQRLWTALVLIVAFEGARRCARVLGLSSHPATLAGLVFAMSPRMLGTVGVISAESLPGAVLPWVVLPILLAARGRIGHVRAAVLSAAAVVCMGGVNAVEVIGSLPMPLLLACWVAWRRLVPRSFLGWWAGLVTLACTWWLLPLLALGRYSPPFYEYVESASNTTGSIGWSEALRGDSHWVAYISTGGQGWWPAAHALMFDPLLVLVAAVVTGIGLLGLLHFPNVMRAPMVTGAVVGLAALTIAHGGWEGSPLSGFFLDALEGPLQVFRNVHKVDPTVRFAIAMGFGHAVAVVIARLRATTASDRAATVVPVLAGALVLVLGQPFLVNDSRSPGWREVPEAWTEAYDYLAERQDGTTTLVVPGSGFAFQSWGWTYDEPMHALGDEVRWTTRSQIPIIPGQSIRVLTAIDRLVSQGQADANLSDQLARAGIGHVLVRRDLNRGFTSSPPPAGAGVSLDSAGLESVATFGDPAEAGPAVEIFEVPDRLPRIRSTVRSDVATVAGSPEAWLPLQGAGLLGPERATVVQGDVGWSDEGATIVTDTNQRRERAFGRVEESLSTVLEDGEVYRLDRSVPDYPVTPGSEQVVATYADGASVRASSSQGYADAYGAVVPQAGPHAAFDGNLRTRWVSSLSGKAREQWLRVSFPEPRALRRVGVLPVVDDRSMAPVRTVQVRTSRESVDVDTNPAGAVVEATLGGEPVDWVEVRVVAVATVSERNQVAIAEVTLDGASLPRTLALPEPLHRGDDLLLTAEPGTRACRATGTLPECDLVRVRAGEEPDGMRRQVEVPQGASFTFQGLAVARASRSAALLLEPFLSEQTVGSTSILGDDPLVSSRFAYDGRLDTHWVPSPRDRQPTLFFQWGVPRRVTAVRLPDGGQVAPGYNRIVVRGGGRVERLTVTGETTQLRRPIYADYLEVSFVKDEAEGLVSVPEIDLDGGGVTRPFDPDLPTGSQCGLGPTVTVSGNKLPTRVEGTLGDVLSGAPMKFTTCRRWDPDGAARVTYVSPGTRTFRTTPTAEFDVVALAGRTARQGGAEQRPVVVEDDDADSASLTARVAEGPEAVLSMPSNFNDGWVARLDGRRVPAVRVDGWQQGWIVPAGAGGVLTVEFAPQGTYTLLLAGGLAAAGSLLLAALALLVLGARARRRGEVAPWRDLPATGRASARGRLVAGVLVAVALGWVAVAAYAVASLWSARDLGRLRGAVLALVVGSGALDAWPQPVPTSVADALAVAAVGLGLALCLRWPSRTEGVR